MHKVYENDDGIVYNRELKTDTAISITGYAGPQFADEPVGKVCIGVCTPDCTTVKEFRFSGNRDRIRTLSVVNALDMLRRALLHLDIPN